MPRYHTPIKVVIEFTTTKTESQIRSDFAALWQSLKNKFTNKVKSHFTNIVYDVALSLINLGGQTWVAHPLFYFEGDTNANQTTIDNKINQGITAFKDDLKTKAAANGYTILTTHYHIVDGAVDE